MEVHSVVSEVKRADKQTRPLHYSFASFNKTHNNLLIIGFHVNVIETFEPKIAPDSY